MNNRQQYTLAAALIVFTVLVRMLTYTNHIGNFAPLVAMSLFVGSRFGNKQLAYIVPLFAALLSDICLGIFTTQTGFYGMSQVVNYLAYFAVVALGTQLRTITIPRVGAFTLGGAAVFFLISNFSTFIDTTYNMYPKTLSGLAACYAAGLAFVRTQVEQNWLLNEVSGHFIFAAFFFGIYALATKTATRKQLA
jgi:hypothetical protein